MRMAWAKMTAETKAEKVRELVEKGEAYSTIAWRLGAPSRSAISGVVNRLRAAGEMPAAQKAEPKPTPTQAKRPAAPKPVVPAPAPIEPPTISISRAAAFDPLPGSDPLSIDVLTLTTCRWPVNGDGREAIFCGAHCELTEPYCTSHSRLAYQPRKEKRHGARP